MNSKLAELLLKFNENVKCRISFDELNPHENIY